MSATDRVNRIALLIAELSRRERRGEPLPSLDDLSQWAGHDPARIKADLRVLQDLNESAEADWFLSLRAYLTSDEVLISSGGPYRRPIRPTADEALALAVGLASLGGEGTSSAATVSETVRELLAPHDATGTPPLALETRPGGAGGCVDAVTDAIRDRRTLSIAYAGSAAGPPTERVIHPHHLITGRGATVIVAWCELRNDWRRFRTDRMLRIAPAEAEYVTRTDIPEGMFAPPEEGVDEVLVRFTPAVARWLRERFPHAEEQPDGSLHVTYLCADANWLVGEVLQYGVDAEVLGPPAYREMMARAAGG